jgi:multisubunit Na+/H+ antiporter MnhB subunit
MVSNIADRFLDLALNQALFGNAGGNIVTGGLFKFLGFANGGRPPVGVPSVVGEKRSRIICSR